MIFNFHLHNEHFEKIKNGSKKIEARLFDEKRKLIKVGYVIIFSNRDTGEILQKEVKEIVIAKSFKELFNLRNIKDFGGKDLEESVSNMYKYYSIEDEEKFGVMGIVL